ncbi:MAG: A/G-specific adenine glycosylase [Promethearchaeota archaeon]|nr:MAG: A/G-specific adenine glycosylase [Candidatus Lokiarchaeota archaeon]
MINEGKDKGKLTLIDDFHKLYKKEGLSERVIESFRKLIYDYYRNYKRDFIFREEKFRTPYYILVSEIMLQQTQTSRVSEKFRNFIDLFPDFKALSEASLKNVLKAWQGLGYNRRAKALNKIADIVLEKYDGELPTTREELRELPQIGEATSGSIMAFAFNEPTIFIETNIRRVYIYFFFPGRDAVSDNEIEELLKKTIDKKNPREWYYALMDYGVMLKKTHPELNKRSKHYRKQSSFKGSNRQIRGKVLKLLMKKPEFTEKEIIKSLDFKEARIKKVLSDLHKEGFLKKEDNKITIPK